MGREIRGTTGGNDGDRPGGGAPGRGTGGRRTHLGGMPRLIDGRTEDRHPWALAALIVPLLFCAIVGVGVFLMFHRNMGYFKPAPSGSWSAPARARAMAKAAPRPAIAAAAARRTNSMTSLATGKPGGA